MAIYKLGELLNFKTGKLNSDAGLEFGRYPFFTCSPDNYWIDEFGFNQSAVLLAGNNANANYSVKYFDGKFNAYQRTYIIDVKREDLVSLKYFYYWLSQQSEYLKSISSGSATKFLTTNKLLKTEMNLCSLHEQQKIIDITEPVEELFLKYSKLVRIDTVENCTSDINDLIDIIEPIEKEVINVQNQIKVLKEILVNQYDGCGNSPVYFADYVQLHCNKYENQSEYLATNAVSEFGIDFSKVQDIQFDDRPSRANLTPIANSLIISKLDGENKAYYVDSNFSYVVSTGFFNFTTDYLDHISGFLLSDSFKKQKTSLSTGTTMTGLNNENLSKIKMIEPTCTSDIYTTHLSKMLNIENKLTCLLSQMIKLLIK